LEIDIYREIEPAIIDGALMRSAGDIPQDFADIGRANLMPISGADSATSRAWIPRTVLSPVSGSAGFGSSVFSSCCATATPGVAASRMTAMNQLIFKNGLELVKCDRHQMIRIASFKRLGRNAPRVLIPQGSLSYYSQ
jgi:hypothetical protein